MKKITRMVLISAVLVTSGLTAKVATENYKAVVSNDERIHKAYELAKKPNKAAVLEAIVDATNAESNERILDAVIIDPEEPKVVRVKTKVTTSAGVSPIASITDKKTVNKSEEFIEKVTHPGETVLKDILDFSPDSVPNVTAPVHVAKYESKDIFPEFEEVEETKEEELTYRITGLTNTAKAYIYQHTLDQSIYGLNIGRFDSDSIDLFLNLSSTEFVEWDTKWVVFQSNDQANIGLKADPTEGTINYFGLTQYKDNHSEIVTECLFDGGSVTYAKLYEILNGIETKTYRFVKEIDVGH